MTAKRFTSDYEEATYNSLMVLKEWNKDYL